MVLIKGFLEVNKSTTTILEKKQLQILKYFSIFGFHCDIFINDFFYH